MQNYIISILTALLPVIISLSIIFFLIQFLIKRERKRNKFAPFTEPFLRSPGYSLSKQLDDMQGELVAFIVMVFIPPLYFYASTRQGFDSTQYALIVGLLLIMLYGIYRFVRYFNKAQRIKLGYYGELYTGQELNYLMRQGAFVYHDIPYKYGNIDHLVVSKGGVFVIETKACRKPTSQSGKKEAVVTIENGALVLPHIKTNSPIKQAEIHAQWMQKKLLVDAPVFPIVALPGWYIKGNNKAGNVWVINPYRGKFLQNLVKKDLISDKDFAIIVKQIEELARDVHHHKSLTDADADRHFDTMLNKRSN